MRIVYQLSLSDVVRFQLYQYDHAEGSRGRRALTTWGGAVAVLAVMAVIAVIAGNWAFVVLGGVLAVLYAYIVPALLRHNLRTTVTRLYAQGPGRRLLGRRELQILDEGLLAVTPDGERIATPWDGVGAVRHTDGYVFVYLHGNSAHVVPRAGLQEGDLDAFTEEVRRRASRERA